MPTDPKVDPTETPSLPALHKRETKVREGFWRTFKKALKQVPFAEELVAAYFCALDKKTPAKVRYTLLGALVYFVSPIDVLPDLLAGIGFTDDAAVLIAVIRSLTAHITDTHRQAAREALEKNDTPQMP